MKTVKRLFSALAGALVLGAACGCSLVQPQQTTLEFGMFAGSNWNVADANSYEIIDRAIQKFESRHKNVKVHYFSGILKEDYSEWLSRKTLQGNMPDVFMVLTNDFYKFSSMGVIKNLNRLMADDPDFHASDFYDTALNTGKYQGVQYALPYETVPELMFVNKTLLQKNGISMPSNNWTWDDMYGICAKVTKDNNGDGTIDQFGAYNYSWIEAAYSNGADFFNSSGTEAYFTNEKVLSSIKFIKRLYDLNRGVQVTQKDFDSGNVAFRPFLFSDYRTYKTYPYKLKKYNQFQWDCITLPRRARLGVPENADLRFPDPDGHLPLLAGRIRSAERHAVDRSGTNPAERYGEQRKVHQYRPAGFHHRQGENRAEIQQIQRGDVSG